MTATTEKAPGACCNRPEGYDNNPTHQDGAEVMHTLPQTIDQKIKAALEPDIFVQDEGDGNRMLVVHVSQHPEVHVYRWDTDADDGTVTRTPWTVCVPYRSQVINSDGDVESSAAARNLASALDDAAQLADRLEEAGR